MGGGFRKRGRLAISAAFLAPALIMFTVFVIVPVFLTTYYSLTDWDGVAPKVVIWFQNFRQLLADPRYGASLRNTLILVGLCLGIQGPAGLILAYLLSRVRSGYRFYRAVFFAPVVVSMAIVAVMFTLLFNADVGPVNYILKLVGLGGLAPSWLSDSRIVLYTVSLPQVWHFIGITFILFLAGLQAIPEEILESARIDGASSSQIFFLIIIPLVWEIIQMVIILIVTGTLRSFDYSWIMTWGGPDVSSSFVAVYMYRMTFREFSFGYGSSIAVSILVFSFLFSVVFKRLASRLQTT